MDILNNKMEQLDRLLDEERKILIAPDDLSRAMDLFSHKKALMEELSSIIKNNKGLFSEDTRKRLIKMKIKHEANMKLASTMNALVDEVLCLTGQAGKSSLATCYGKTGLISASLTSAFSINI